MQTGYEETIREERERKERYFGTHPRSPIPPDRQDDFPGLDYYPVDPEYRFELELHRHEDPERFTVETTTGGEQSYLRWGEFRFTLEGEDLTLQAYKPGADADRLWVPFRDDTNNVETYGAGRYLDLDADEHLTGDGTWILDFNRAYNPTCAYNAGYECPLIPLENWLDVPVEAGEKDYPGEPVDPFNQGHGHGQGHDHEGDHDHEHEGDHDHEHEGAHDHE